MTKIEKVNLYSKTYSWCIFLGFLYAGPWQLYSTICFVEQKSERAGLQEKIVSPPTSGLAWRGRRRARSWTGSLLSTPLAACFGPGPEEAGRTAGQRYFFPLLSPPTSELALRRGIGACSWMRNFVLRLSPLTSGLARMGRRGGAKVDVEFAFLAFLRFSPQTSSLAWMGLWGALPWRGVCLSIFQSLASRREAKLCSVTGPNPKTVKQTLPPWWDGELWRPGGSLFDNHDADPIYHRPNKYGSLPKYNFAFKPHCWLSKACGGRKTEYCPR